MRLTELEPQFLKRTSSTLYEFVPTLAEADGIMLHCPKCFLEEPRGIVGCHSILCWFVGKVPDDCHPIPGRWSPTGTGYHDLDFMSTKPSASVLLTGPGCGAHFLIQNGEVTLC